MTNLFVYGLRVERIGASWREVGYCIALGASFSRPNVRLSDFAHDAHNRIEQLHACPSSTYAGNDVANCDAVPNGWPSFEPLCIGRVEAAHD